MDKKKLKKLFYEVKATTSDVIFTVFMFGMLYLLIHAIITDVKGDDNRIKGSSITVTSKGHEYIIFETDRGSTCCIHSASCPCEKKTLKAIVMDNKMNMLKEVLGEDGLDRLAGLSDKCFFIKKEDIEKTFGQNLINDGSILVGDKSHFIPVDLTSDTTTQAEEPRRNFRCSFTIVDKQEERYNAQMLVVCVLPVFGKLLFPVTPPHLAFRLADGYTTLYRNRHNFFYAAMRNLFSHSFSEKSEEEQLFERLETAQEFGNYEYNPLLTSDSIVGQQGENKKKRI